MKDGLRNPIFDQAASFKPNLGTPQPPLMTEWDCPLLLVSPVFFYCRLMKAGLFSRILVLSAVRKRWHRCSGRSIFLLSASPPLLRQCFFFFSSFEGHKAAALVFFPDSPCAKSLSVILLATFARHIVVFSLSPFPLSPLFIPSGSECFH